MVVKVDKSEEFIKSGRKLISEYDNKTFFMEEKDKKERDPELKNMDDESLQRYKENLQEQADNLLKEMEALNDAKNGLAKRRAQILAEIKKLDAVLEMTEPTF